MRKRKPESVKDSVRKKKPESVKDSVRKRKPESVKDSVRKKQPESVKDSVRGGITRRAQESKWRREEIEEGKERHRRGFLSENVTLRGQNAFRFNHTSICCRAFIALFFASFISWGKNAPEDGRYEKG